MAIPPLCLQPRNWVPYRTFFLSFLLIGSDGLSPPVATKKYTKRFINATFNNYTHTQQKRGCLSPRRLDTVKAQPNGEFPTFLFLFYEAIWKERKRRCCKNRQKQVLQASGVGGTLFTINPSCRRHKKTHTQQNASSSPSSFFLFLAQQQIYYLFFQFCYEVVA